MAVFGITSKYVWFALPMTGFAIGWFLDNKETQRMVRYRDKSALYGREGVTVPSW